MPIVGSDKNTQPERDTLWTRPTTVNGEIAVPGVLDASCNGAQPAAKSGIIRIALVSVQNLDTVPFLTLVSVVTFLV
jgi:hypothetical protein